MIQIDSEFLYVEEKHEHDCKMKNVNVRKKRYFPSQTFKEIFFTIYGIKEKAKIESFAI